MVNIEEPFDTNTYCILDMFRIPSAFYPSMITICEFITRRGNACSGVDAVKEVLLHPQSYERRQDTGYSLLTDDDLDEIEREVVF